MKLTKSSLCNLLLAEGEEDLAALVAGSGLPEDLDTDRDAAALAALGLPDEELHALLPAVTGGADARPGLSPAEMAGLEQTISDRWAQLVRRWVS
ncbi:MAG TPA: hypothetical protein VHW44_24260 [Pseudonocardiaceae bacterium]|nr:hypothetical protein [Pseudonocardiaceae bacterium]